MAAPSDGLNATGGDHRDGGDLETDDRSDTERSIGYAEFCERLGRLIRLQHSLIDFLDFLDPDVERFPEHRRKRLAKQSPRSD